MRDVSLVVLGFVAGVLWMAGLWISHSYAFARFLCPKCNPSRKERP